EEPPPAGSEHRHGQQHDQRSDDEPGEVGFAKDVHRRTEVDLPHEIGDRGNGQDQRPDDPDRALHPTRSARTARVSCSNAMFAAATAVCWPGPSYGGLTSTTSYPENESPPSARTNPSASRVLSPPASGVPVPGAKAGSRTSTSKEKKSGPSPTRLRTFSPYSTELMVTSSSQEITSNPS